MAKVILKAQDLDGYLNQGDKKTIEDMNGTFNEALKRFTSLDGARAAEQEMATEELINLYNEMGHAMQEIVAREPR
ncbi:MAG: uracil phosphoribosyltransferase, partial [Spirochaetia bacterium]